MRKNQEIIILIGKKLFYIINSKDLIKLPIENEDYRIDYGIAYHRNNKVDYIKYFIRNFI